MTTKIRRRVVATLIIVATVIAPAGVTAFWAQQTITNSDRYVATVSGVFTAQSVRTSLSQAVTETIAESQVVEDGIGELLPDRLSILSPLLTSALANLAGNITEKVLVSEATDAIANFLATQSYKALMAVLDGSVDEAGPFFSDGALVLDLSIVSQDVSAQISERSPALGSLVSQVVAKLPTIVLLEENQLSLLRTIYGIASPVLVALLPFTLILYVAAVVISHDRNRTLMQAGATFVGSQGLLALGLWWVKDAYIGELGGGVFGPVVVAIFDQLLTYLWESILISVLIGAIAFFAGLAYTLKRNSTTSSSRIT